MKLIFAFLLLGCAFASCESGPPIRFKHDPNYTHVYVCPMDCEKGKMYGQPGECPVCHMDLKQKDVRLEDLNRTKDSTGIK